MNPEEGELRPQLLDRFGLAIDVTASKDPAVRAEIVARRLDFDADPESFVTRFAADDDALHARIDRARALLDDVELTPNILGQIATVCAAFDVDGMRADIVIARTARAHAAWRVAGDESAQPAPDNQIEITAEDIKVAAEMALPHRRRRDPFDEPGLDQEQLDDALQDAEEQFRDDQNQPESSPESDPEPDAEQVSQFDSNSEPQEPQQSNSSGSKGGRAAEGAPFRRS